LCHLNTALRPKVYSSYACLINWKVLLADLPNFWQNLTFSRCSNCDIINFRRSQISTLHNSEFLSGYTHANASFWIERRTYTAPSRGFTYPL
jgi:hypothetical protein